jgi:Fe-S-cluster containining protein
MTNVNLLTAEINVSIAGAKLRLNLSVPDQETRPDIVLPLLWELTDAVEQIAVSQVSNADQHVSCKKGCGACCRQFVPVTPLEARFLNEYVSELPKARQQEIRTRFKQAQEQLENAGIVEKLLNISEYEGDLETVGLEYFNLGIPCPFLEDESCSIHKVRPLRCREYLVTNPAKFCKSPTRETINMVPFPAHLSLILARLNLSWSKYSAWAIPLSLAPLWLERHPEEPPVRHSKAWIDEVLTALSKKNKPVSKNHALMMASSEA